MVVAWGWRALLAGGMVALGCSPASPAPVGEVMLTVDTDAPVPTLASRLRVDLFDSTGTWFASRDFGLPDPSDWPTSFAVSAREGGGAATVTVRLRAYSDGEVRDYLGETFQDRPDATAGHAGDIIPTPTPPAGATPRLYDGSQDVTPVTEPLPLVAIDRLLRVTIVPGVVQGGAVVMRGACFGTMADVAGDATCVDTEATRVADADLPLSSPPPAASPSLAGTFGASQCTATPRTGTTAGGMPLHDEEVCVPGGAFVFGNTATPGIDVDQATSAPAHVAVMPPLRMDRYEMTVARYRAILRAGYTGPQALANDGPIPSSAGSVNVEETTPYCTYSDQPLDRETLPLTCASWTTARAVCQFLGGDLPTEAEWEYVAAQSGRASKTRFPWNDEPPTCLKVVFGRGVDFVTSATDPCARMLGFGPQPVGSSGDTSEGLGVSDLAGNATEWMLDTAVPLSSRCWMSAPLAAPSCQIPGTVSYSQRGGAWLTPYGSPIPLLVTTRARGQSTFSEYSEDGFRCVRDGGGS
jgi:formylglycine-generating enzyme required for sulfatase activity